MKKIIYTIGFAIICYSSVCQTQRTVTFKPDSTIGQDASIGSLNGNLNDNNTPELWLDAWTWNSVPGTVRSFLKFDELSTIPACATIIGAELKLYGVTYYTNIDPVGNSCYPGSPYSSYCPNQGFIQKVTSSWDAQTVTWNTQPTTTTVNQIIIPASTSQWNEHFTDNSANIVAMVQDWVSNPATNYGFMLRMETEARYRCIFFASSDHPVDSLHPELTVTYLLNDTCMDCEMAANFSYTVNTAEPNSYFFKASYPGSSQYWVIDGGAYIYADTLTYVFSTGNHEVCFYRIHPMYNNESYRIAPIYCEKCITICVEGQENLNIAKATKNNLSKEKKTGIETRTDVKHGTIPFGDIIPIDDDNIDKIKVYPNPTNSEWNIIIFNDVSDKITISLYELNGKLLYNEVNNIIAGENLFKIESKNFNTGHYVIKIEGKSVNYNSIITKQ
jgi:hypothetical protein